MHKYLDHSELKRQLSSYLLDIISSFTHDATSTGSRGGDAKQTANDIFRILTGRNYSHLSRGKAELYRENITKCLEQDILSDRPVTFFYDLGPGYHASLYPEQMDLSFEIGLSELFALYQISEFARDVSKIYPNGVQFSIIIDNLCALATNDIATDKTEYYCAELRSLIRETGAQSYIKVLVESELFDEADYPRVELAEIMDTEKTLSEEQIENVSRFVGRRCDMSEAQARIANYARATEVTESNLSGVVTGVRLTQRATDATLGFRSYPGGDSRIQAGEIAITHNKKGALRPVLLTSRNIAGYDQYRFELPDGAPESLQHITYVKTSH